MQTVIVKCAKLKSKIQYHRKKQRRFHKSLGRPESPFPHPIQKRRKGDTNILQLFFCSDKAYRNQNAQSIFAEYGKDIYCPSCRSPKWKKHGSYERYWIQFDEIRKEVEDTRIKIHRIRCTSCKSTHAIFPRDVVPYCAYSLLFLRNLYTRYFQGKEKIQSLCGTFHVSFQTLYLILKRWYDIQNALWFCLCGLAEEIPTEKPTEKKMWELFLKYDETKLRWQFLLTTNRIFLMHKRGPPCGGIHRNEKAGIFKRQNR